MQNARIKKNFLICGGKENGSMMECWNDGVVEWWNDGMVEWWNGGMME